LNRRKIAGARRWPNRSTRPRLPSRLESSPTLRRSDSAPEPAAAEAVSDGRARDESGRFVKQDAKPAESDKPQLPPPAAKPGLAGQGAAAGATASAAAPAAPPAFKPPQSWKPTVREHWGALPAEVQAEVDRREREIAKALQESAEASKGAGTWQETVRPYEAQIRAAGGNPQQYVGSLLQTAHALSYGHPQQKASIVAGLAMQFGISPQDLDSAPERSRQIGSERASVHAASEGGIQFHPQYAGRRR
jgi:hypothetical protein